MGFWSFFSSLWRKLKWLFNYLYGEFNRVYPILKPIIRDIRNSDLENDDARRAVFQRTTDSLQAMGINISDSKLNLYIEVAYQLLKLGKA